jgi:hypothetical protein
LLRKGQRAEFEVSMSPRGLRATEVKVIGRDFKKYFGKRDERGDFAERRVSLNDNEARTA